MGIQCTLRLIKNNTKSNLTASISRFEDGSIRSYNFTGKLIECKGFRSSEGKDYSNEVVEIECGTTVLLNELLGGFIYKEAGDIFAKRAAEGDKNPCVELQIECKSLNVTETNIIISNVMKAQLDSSARLADNTDRIMNNLAALKTRGAQVNAARAGMGSLLNTVKKVAKTYL